jgi:hypothetical protein
MIAGLILLCMLTLGFAQPASAATKVLVPGEEYTKTVNADILDSIEYSWSSTATVNFELTDPMGSVLESYSGTVNEFPGFTMAGVNGNYHFTWTNPGSSSVTLTYDLSGGGGVGGALDFAFWLLVIGAIVIVVIIVVVVLVVLRGGKKAVSPQQQVYGPQQFAAPGTPAPYAANTCPKCGGPIDPQQVFCPKCGFKMR